MLQSLLAGYAFDGLVFHRAAVNKAGEIINAVTKQPIGVDPTLVLWYTRREFQNALAKYQQIAGSSVNSNLASVAPTAELMAILTDQGHLRTTRDHILHMLTAGRERVLGRKFTEKEIAEFGLQADRLLGELVAPTATVSRVA